MEQPPFLSIVIPAYNEEQRLPNSLARLEAFAARQAFTIEIVFSDDGSTDGTRALLQSFAAGHSPATRSGGAAVTVRVLGDSVNRGKGSAVRLGMLAASGEHVLFSDADLSTPLEETALLLEAVRQGADVAIGSRGLRSSRLLVREPWYRELLGRSGNLVIQLVAVPGIKDTQCGFKLFTRRAAQAVFSQSVMDGISFDVEILYLARRMGLRIAEVPISWSYDRQTRIKLLRDSYRMLRDLVLLRARHHGLRPLPQPAPEESRG